VQQIHPKYQNRFTNKLFRKDISQTHPDFSISNITKGA